MIGLIIIAYICGAVFLGSKCCCFCGDHGGHDLLCLLFWPIAYPYERWFKTATVQSTSPCNVEKEWLQPCEDCSQILNNTKGDENV